MKKKQICLLIVLILVLSFGLNGCEKNDNATTTETETSEEMIGSEEQLSSSMSHYQEVAKENILLLAQKKHLDIAIQYYTSIEMNQSADGFKQKSFEEEIFGTNIDADTDSEELMDYPEFNPEAVEIIIPEISEEEAETKSLELEAQNEELRKVIADRQEELDNYKLISGL